MIYRDTNRPNLQHSITNNRMQYLIRYINGQINRVFDNAIVDLRSIFTTQDEDGLTIWDSIVNDVDYHIRNGNINDLVSKRNYIKTRLTQALGDHKKTIRMFKLGRGGRYQVDNGFVNDIMSYYRNIHPNDYSNFINSNVRQLNNGRYIFYPYTDSDFKSASFLNDFQTTINTIAMKMKKGRFANYFKSPYVSLLMKNNQQINFDFFVKNNIQNFGSFLNNANIVVHPHTIQYWGTSGVSVSFPANFVPLNNARIFEGFTFGLNFDIDKLAKHLSPSFNRLIKNPYNDLKDELRPLIPTYGTASIYFVNYKMKMSKQLKEILNDLQMFDTENISCISKHCLIHSFDYFIKTNHLPEKKQLLIDLKQLLLRFIANNKLHLENINIDALFGNKKEYRDNHELRDFLIDNYIQIRVHYEGLNRNQIKVFGPKTDNVFMVIEFFVQDMHIMPLYITSYNSYHFGRLIPFFYFEDKLKENEFIRNMNIDIYNTAFNNITVKMFMECSDLFSNTLFSFLKDNYENNTYKEKANRFRFWYRVYKLYLYDKFRYIKSYDYCIDEISTIFDEIINTSLIRGLYSFFYNEGIDYGLSQLSEFDLRRKLKNDYKNNNMYFFKVYIGFILDVYLKNDIENLNGPVNFLFLLNESINNDIRLTDFEIYVLFSPKEHTPCKLNTYQLYNSCKEVGYIKLLEEDKYHVIQELKINNVIMNKMIIPKIDDTLIEIEQKIDEPSERKDKDNYLLGFCDFEASSSGDYHRPFMVILYYQYKNIMYTNEFVKKEFIGINCNTRFMEHLFDIMVGNNIEQFIIYTHNLMYDSRFFREFDCCSYIEKGNRCYQQIHVRNVMDKNRTIIFKDFLSMTNTALKNIPSWFKNNPVFNNVKKEYMYYDSMDICYNACLEGNRDCKIFCTQIVEYGCTINKLPDFDYLLALIQFYNLDLEYHEEKRVNDIAKVMYYCVPDEFYINIVNYYFDQVNCLSEDEKLDIIRLLEGREENDLVVINYMDYVKFYCHQDVYILANGFVLFNNLIKDSIINLNIVDFLTSPSLSKNYFQRSLFYNKPGKSTYKCSGCLQQFLLQCCHGGKCMTRRNRKVFVENGQIFNIDCNSLYPSAMSTLYIVKNIRFIPIPDFYTSFNFSSVQLPDFFYIWLHTFIIKLENKIQLDEILLEKFMSRIQEEPDFYVYGFALRINITKINNFYSFPAIVRKTKDGKANTNTIGECYVTEMGLFDLIVFHDIEFEIKEGCIYIDRDKDLTNVEFDIQTLINSLYNMRREFKREKNPMELCIKLLLNSGYGSLMQKPIGTEIEIVDKENLDNTLENLNEDWKSVEQLTDTNNNFIDKFIIKKVKDKSQHFNHAYIAASVLAKSKHIMHKVMFLAEDNNIDIFYTDTDSIHMDGSKYELLKSLYYEKYGRELNGTNLQQFHNDFEVNNGVYDNISNEELKNIDTNEDLYADMAVYLGKKMYCERIRSFAYPDGIGINFKLKGIPEEVIVKHANENYPGINEVERIFKLYMDIYNGAEVIFDLLSTRVRFKIGHSMISNVKSFTRKIKTRYTMLTNTPILYNLSNVRGDDLCILAEREYASTLDPDLCNDIKFELDEYRCIRNYPKDTDRSFLELENQTIVTSYLDVELSIDPEETVITIEEDQNEESDNSYEEY